MSERRWSLWDTPSMQQGFGQYRQVRRMCAAGFQRLYRGQHHRLTSGIRDGYDRRNWVRVYELPWQKRLREEATR